MRKAGARKSQVILGKKIKSKHDKSTLSKSDDFAVLDRDVLTIQPHHVT